MHYTGTIWRPPYEASSLLIEVTAGCTHHKCKFCTLYDDLPFQFRMSPLKDIESDLAEAQMLYHDPFGKISLKLQGLPSPHKIHRVYLVGANPFVLNVQRLEHIADLIHKYFPECESIGCFSRITDISLKTDEQLNKLKSLGYDGLTIGVETGDEQSLAFMNKGYTPEEIILQSNRLDQAGITYNYFYLTGISGAGRGNAGAMHSAEIFNQTHPRIIGASMLTVFPESELYQEIQAGNWEEAGELEKLEELKTLIEHLTIPVFFAALGASNAIHLQGNLPEDKEYLISCLKKICHTETEETLQYYRNNLTHL